MSSFLKIPFAQATGLKTVELFYIAIGLFLSIILALIIAILITMLVKSKVIIRQKQLQLEFKQWLVSIVLQESHTNDHCFEIPDQIKLLLFRPFPRQTLLTELIKLKNSMSGQSGENLRKLYWQLRLDRNSVKKLHSSKWYLKASGIQELAIMEQNDYLPDITALVNHKHPMVRMEAQLAMVKLQQYNGLFFLENLVYPLTEWNQIKLLQLLAHQPIPNADIIRGWLKSANYSVVQFALKLITEQYAGQFQQEVIACLNHSLKTVRHQAIICLGELPSQNVASALRTHYATETSKELQLSILSGLIKAGSADDIPFLEALLLTPDHCVQLMASKTLLNLQQQTFK